MAFLLESDIEEIWSHLDYIEQLRDRHILLTGGRGFLGRYFTALVQKINEHVPHHPVRLTIMDNFISSGDAGRVLPEQSANIRLLDHDCIQPYPKLDTVDYVIHAAGIASPAHYKKHPLKTLEVATTGLRNSLDVAMTHSARITFFSSSEIYGDPDPKFVPTDEEYRGNVSCLGPRACYDESKRLGETLVRIHAEQYGVQGTIIRPFNVYGPGMQKTDYRVLPNFGARIMAGEPVHIYGKGDQTRTFCYVTDAIDGFMRVLIRGAAGEPYNVGNPEPEISVLGLADEIGQVLGREVKYEITPYPDTYPADEPNRRCPKIDKVSTLGYRPRVTLREGLGRFFKWAAEHY